MEIAAGGGPDRARAIGLSLVYPEDDPNMEREFQDLRRLAGPKVAIVVGGRAAASYRATLDQFGALFITDLTQLQVELARLRASLL